jgi:hypothetical protein
MAKTAKNPNSLVMFLTDFAVTAKEVLLNPRGFFDQISTDGGWAEPLRFMCVCAGVFAIMSSVLATGFVTRFAGEMGLPAVSGLLYFAGTCLTIFLGVMVGSFFMSGAITVVLHFLGGKGTFASTYRVLACCWVVLLFSWIPVIGWLGGLYMFVLVWYGVRKAHDVPGWKAVISVLVGPCALTAVSTVLLLLASTGASAFIHERQPSGFGPIASSLEAQRIVRAYERDSGGAYDASNGIGLKGSVARLKRGLEAEAVYQRLLRLNTSGEEISLASAVQPHKMTVVYFHSPKCPASVQMEPLVEKLALSRPDLVVAVVNIDRADAENIDFDSPAAQQCGIQAVPAFKIFSENQELVAEDREAKQQVKEWMQQAHIVY